MDIRDNLKALLTEYRPYDAREQQAYDEICTFVDENPSCFENNHLPGHITGAALVIDHDREHVLLTHHTILNRWFQFGGHSDGDGDVVQTAIREAREESGCTSLQAVPGQEGIFDVDAHMIPAHRSMPAHMHYDIRILLSADRNEPYTVSHESHDLRWVPIRDVAHYNNDPTMLRMVGKVSTL